MPKAGTEASPSATGPAPARELRDLTRLIQRASGFPECLAALLAGRSATIDGAWGSAGPLASAALGLNAPKTLLIVLAHVGDVDDFRDDVATFAGVTPEVFPAWDKLPREAGPADEVFGRRLRVVKALRGANPPRFVVAPIQAFLQPVPTAEALAGASRRIWVGQSIAVEDLAGWLLGRGMARVEVVEVAGEFSARGGILDVFPPDAPTRSGSSSSATRSSRSAPSTPAPSARSASSRPSTSPPPSASTATTPRPSPTPPTPSRPGPGSPWSSRTTSARKAGTTSAGSRTPGASSPSTPPSPSWSSTPRSRCRRSRPTRWRRPATSGSRAIERFSGELSKVKAELDAASGGDKAIIACHNPAEVERLGEVFAGTEIARSGRLALTVGRIRAGFHLIDARTLVIGDHELFARADVRRPATRRRYESRAIDSFLDLNEGDLVVHVNHGIARYRGLQLVKRGDEHDEETLLLEFAEGTKLFVPIAKIDLVQKYVGGGKGNPRSPRSARPPGRSGRSGWPRPWSTSPRS